MMSAAYVTYQNRLLVNKKTNEFMQLLDEAKSVKEDLEQLMEQAVNVSRCIVDNINSCLAKPSSSGITDDISEEISINHADTGATDSGNRLSIMGEFPESEVNNIDSEDEQYNQTNESMKERQVEEIVDLQNIYSDVSSLYKRGLTAKEIAQKLNKGQDEVSMILNINNMKYINT